MISLKKLLNEEIHTEEYTVENYHDIKEFFTGESKFLPSNGREE